MSSSARSPSMIQYPSTPTPESKSVAADVSANSKILLLTPSTRKDRKEKSQNEDKKKNWDKKEVIRQISRKGNEATWKNHSRYIRPENWLLQSQKLSQGMPRSLKQQREDLRVHKHCDPGLSWGTCDVTLDDKERNRLASEKVWKLRIRHGGRSCDCYIWTHP